MTGRRITFAVLLAAAIVLYIFYEAFLSWYLLLCVLLCPLFSLLVSLPAMYRSALTISAPESIVTGQDCILCVHSSGRSRLPFGRLSFRVFVKDAAGRYVMRPKEYSLAGYGGSSLNLHVSASHCGFLSVTVYQAVITDLLGLFSHRLSCPPASVTLILPVPAQPDILPFPTAENQKLHTPVSGPAEEYTLREWRSGDPVRSIHWKLSAKTEDLIVREPPVTGTRRIQIAFAFGGTEVQADQTLSHLLWLCLQVLEQNVSCCVIWLDAKQHLQQMELNSRQALNPLFRTLLLSASPKLPQYPEVQGAFYLDREGDTR